VINSARRRLWIVSPYFVPDIQVVSALQVAALKGVDVRIMLPKKSDNLLVDLSAHTYIEEMEQSGVKFFRYQPGFLHQKVILVDDDTAAVGTANLDNRSFRLNFEITVLVVDKEFAGQVSDMLEKDFDSCQVQTSEYLQNRTFVFKLATKIARLFAPVQ
jgi:cardiolipin synthase